ncbi:hypothetical protein DL764_002146 [Monosporascus ibericus]|uniref:Uncharacterized protein n=1 Tax=Monosporascus ibericus TaxID=155417 RepID=A0A4Q4TQW6_9PEZI|nr:hypothetical protein DL764_002146 [Monosporascus ibericus]
MSAPSTHKNIWIKALARTASGKAQDVRVPLHRRTMCPSQRAPWRRTKIWSARGAFRSRTNHRDAEEQHDSYHPGDAAKGNQHPNYDGNGKREVSREHTFAGHYRRLDTLGGGAVRDPTSRGPNLVNTVEGNYCDMSDQTLWLVCVGEEVADDCFDKDAQVSRAEGLSARDSQHDEIIDWTADQSQADRRRNSDSPRKRS